MPSRAFYATVSAICYSACCRFSVVTYERHIFPNNQAVSFVIREYNRMPDWLAIGIRVGVVALRCYSRMRTSRSFTELNPERREHVLHTWEKMRVGACRELVRFFEVLTLLGCADVLARQEKTMTAEDC